MAKKIGQTVGVLELRLRARSILRRVQERQEAANIVDKGNVIARIVPIHNSNGQAIGSLQEPDGQPESPHRTDIPRSQADLP